MRDKRQNDDAQETGSTELIVIGLIAALIIVLAMPLLSDISGKTDTALSNVNSQMP